MLRCLQRRKKAKLTASPTDEALGKLHTGKEVKKTANNTDETLGMFDTAKENKKVANKIDDALGTLHTGKEVKKAGSKKSSVGKTKNSKNKLPEPSVEAESDKLGTPGKAESQSGTLEHGEEDAAQAAQKTRLTDVSEEPLMLLGPIVGVMDVARKTLMEAAADTGLPHMDACGFMATEKGRQIAADGGSGLDADEAGALNLYTMESELYPMLNQCLRDRDRTRLKPYFAFLQLMILARLKLPKYTGTVWRGVKADLRKQYPVGKEVYWWAFSSTTQKLSTLNNPMFLGQEGIRTIFNLQVRSGVDIARFSVFEGEEAEVLLFPGTKFKVVDAMDMGGGLFQVHLEEVAVPVQLIK